MTVELTHTQLEWFYAQYVANRANNQPPECSHGEKCWVQYGPPCIDSLSRCRGCGGNCYRTRLHEHT